MSRGRSEETPGSIKVTAAVFFIIAAVMLAVGLLSLKRYNDLKERCTEQAQGLVTRVEEQVTRRRRGGRSVSYKVTAVFMTENQTVYSAHTTENVRSFEKGENVTVKYDPDSPSDCYIVGASGNYGTMFFIMSGVLVIMGAATLTQLKKHKFKRNLAGQTFEEWQDQNTWR